MGAGKATCITIAVIALVGVAVVAVLALAQGETPAGSLRDAREAAPKGQNSEGRRLEWRQDMDHSDYQHALMQQQVWGSGIQDFGGISFHNTIACLLGQAAIADFINEDWYAVSFDLGVCPDNQNGDAESAEQIMNSWVRVSQPSLFRALAGLEVELVVFDNGMSIYLHIRLRGDSTDEAPFGDYELTMIQEVPEDQVEMAGMEAMRLTLYTTEVEGKSTLFSTMTMVGLNIGGGGGMGTGEVRQASESIDLSMSTIFQYDQELGEGLFIDDGYSMFFAMTQETPPAEGCRIYNTISYSPDYVYWGNPQATAECGLSQTEVEASDWFYDMEQCLDVADYTEHCWEVILFNEEDGSAIEGRSVMWGGFEAPDSEWGWGWISCEVAGNGNDTCCHIEGHNVTSDGPLLFEAYESTGIEEYTATAQAGSACSGGFWNWYDTQVVITDDMNMVVEFTPPFVVHYNHTQANDRNGVNDPVDGQFEYRPGGYNSPWFLNYGSYIKDGTLMGDSDQYIAMCPWIYQEFQPTAIENCDSLPEASDALFNVEAPEPREIPDDVPTDIPVVVDVVGGQVVGAEMTDGNHM